MATIIEYGVPSTGEDIFKELVQHGRTCIDCKSVFIPDIEDVTLGRYMGGSTYIRICCPVCECDLISDDIGLRNFQWQRLLDYQIEIGIVPKPRTWWQFWS